MKQELHPIEVLLLVALAAGWAVLTLARAVLVPLVVLVVTLAGWRPAATAPTQAPTVQPQRTCAGEPGKGWPARGCWRSGRSAAVTLRHGTDKNRADVLLFLPQGALDRPPAPAPHPLALVAAELEALPVTALRQLAGVRSKRTRKIDLVAMVAACG
jgi:hypothetical protein